jgi:hypothetical protein
LLQSSPFLPIWWAVQKIGGITDMLFLYARMKNRSYYRNNHGRQKGVLAASTFVRSIYPTHMEGFWWNFIEMFTTVRSCVLGMNKVSRSNVKVTHRGHWKMLIQSKTCTCIEGLRYYFTQMFTIVSWSVTRKIQVPADKIMVTYRGQSLNKNIKMYIE